MPRSTLPAVLGLALLAAGCGQEPETASAPIQPAALASPAAPAAAIDAVDLTAHVKVLASDEFGGREPASPGEEKTVAYLTEQFSQLGLEPGNNGAWTQEVPLVAITATNDISLKISGGEPLEFKVPEQAVAWTKHVTDAVKLEDSELVFVGYGTVAPEYHWNDYEGLDVEGKTVVMLVNDPGYATENPELFNGRAMTYYGRWTYKFEEAARQGAAGAIVIHETGPAGYPWEVVSGSWTGPQFDLVAEDRNFSRAMVEGWITSEAAEKLFGAAGLDFAALKQAAKQQSFKPVPMNLRMSTEIENEVRQSTSHNVLAAIPGSKRPDETVIYTAHWDHLGTDLKAEGDGIYNGAVDNATGVAGLLELAEAFQSLPEKPERTVLFLAVTAEESGLLGSRYYGEHPAYPLAQTVAAINMDSMNVYGPTRDVVVVGYGKSELEEYLKEAANAQGRVIVPEQHPERGYFYRSDHFNFAKQGVPALYAESGSDYTGENATAAAKLSDEYTSERYHKPADEYADWWNLEGAVSDLNLYFEIGRKLANSRAFPNWYEGTEFRAIREQSRQAAANQ